MAFPEQPIKSSEFAATDSGTESGYGNLTNPEHPQLSGIDFGERTMWNQTVDVIHELEQYDALTEANHILGLPEDTSWKQIKRYIDRQDYKYLARHFGLPEDSDEGVVYERLEREEEKKEEETWLARVKALGLPEETTEKEVHEVERKNKARELGLHGDAPWSEIYRAERAKKRKMICDVLGINEDMHWDWEDVLRRALCLSGSASTEDVIGRIQQIRREHIKQVVSRCAADRD